MGAVPAPRPWSGSGTATRRPHDPRQARLHARPSASLSARRLAARKEEDAPPKRFQSLRRVGGLTPPVRGRGGFREPSCNGGRIARRATATNPPAIWRRNALYNVNQADSRVSLLVSREPPSTAPLG